MVNLTYKTPTKEVIGMKRLPIILLIVTMLLAGCIGAKKPVYDGSPTALNVVIKRDTATASALVESEPEDYIHVQIWKENDQGVVIYNVYRQIPVTDDIEYVLNEVVPSDKQYEISAVYGEEYCIEAAKRSVDVPAETSTTVVVNLQEVKHILHKPEAIYSGGSTSQFWIDFPGSELEFDWRILLSNGSWKLENDRIVALPPDDPDATWYVFGVLPKQEEFFYEINEPIEMKYRYWFWYKVPGTDVVLQYHYPDLRHETEFPTIMYYPEP